MKKVTSLILFSFLLIGCSNVSTNESIDSSSEQSSVEVQNTGFDFTTGVDGQNMSYADIDNYTNIEGISYSGTDVYVLYKGTVIDNITPDSTGTFNYRNKSSDEPSDLTFSDDDTLSLGNRNIEVSNLENKKVITVFPNEEYLAQLSEESNNSSELSLKLNEEAMIADSENNPLYSIKITSATNYTGSLDDDYSDIYTKGKPDNTVEITYEYKNYSYASPLEVKSQFLSVYDENGMAGEKVSMQDGQTEVPEGKSASATTWFVMADPITDLSSIEIVYGGDFSLGFEDYYTFEIPLE